MTQYNVTIMPQQVTVKANEGENLLEVLRAAGIHLDAPCGGHGTCKKCKVMIPEEVLACQTEVDRDMTVTLMHQASSFQILTGGMIRHVALSEKKDAKDGHYYQVGFDIGTTTVVGYLIDGVTGDELAVQSVLNPQSQYGADVILRADYVLHGGGQEMASCIRMALSELIGALCNKASINRQEIREVSAVGNSCMQHLFLNLQVDTLVKAPYHPDFYDGYEIKANEVDLGLSSDATLKILPNIGGFVGSDTVACMIAADYANLDDISLLVDIGTNGEVVLGNKDERYACSTAAGPALEGAKITCGMRGAAGAVDHVLIENGKLTYTVIGGGTPLGICGSGLIDLIALLVEQEIVDEGGLLIKPDEVQTDFQKEHAHMLQKVDGMFSFVFTEHKKDTSPIYLTQKDIREIQLAKSAIASGIACLCNNMHIGVKDIKQAWIAGAFGNYMDIKSACAIGLVPKELEKRFSPIGNAAGEGAKIVLFDDNEYRHSNELARQTHFVELASLPEFQDLFVDNLSFEP